MVPLCMNAYVGFAVDCDSVYLKSVRQSGTTMTSGFGDRSVHAPMHNCLP